ncbi:MAG: hypothetical protein IPF99_21935 [Deltaproteobacteria bacterium]|nr:hypothetical protein [Deltaproteobacteria bacterium]
MREDLGALVGFQRGPWPARSCSTLRNVMYASSAAPAFFSGSAATASGTSAARG